MVHRRQISSLKVRFTVFFRAPRLFQAPILLKEPIFPSSPFIPTSPIICFDQKFQDPRLFSLVFRTQEYSGLNTIGP